MSHLGHEKSVSRDLESVLPKVNKKLEEGSTFLSEARTMQENLLLYVLKDEKKNSQHDKGTCYQQTERFC